MHFRGIQNNPYAQLDALKAAQRADARREAAQVRKELVESASEYTRESEDSELYVAGSGQRDEAQEHGRRERRSKERASGLPAQSDEGDQEQNDLHISDWA